MRMPPHGPGMLQDGDRGDHDQRALDHGCHELRLGVTVGVVEIGGLGSKPEGNERHAGGGHIHHGFQRVGIEGGAAGDPPGRCFQRQDQTSHADAGGGNAHHLIQTAALSFRVPAL